MFRYVVRATNTLRRGARRKTPKVKTRFRTYTSISHNFRRRKALYAHKFNAPKRSPLVSSPIPSILMNRRSFGSVAPLKSIDALPGDYDFSQTDTIRIAVDAQSFFDEKYEIARSFDAESPMLKLNAFGSPGICLFSHDLVKQWQQYELNGQTKRTLAPSLKNLLGRSSTDMDGSVHKEWRKKAASAFKPNVVGALAPLIEQSARLGLQHMCDESERTGQSVNFCDEANKFAFDVGARFVYGPLMNEAEIAEMLPIFKIFDAGVGPEGAKDPEGKDPNSVVAKALAARQKLVELLAPKFEEAQRLTRDDAWEENYCLIRSLLENDALFDNDGTYGLEDKVLWTLGLLFAAYDTSATSMTNLVYAMWKHPQHTENARRGVLAHKELSDAQKCVELECFVNEAQRVFGLVSLGLRSVSEPKGLEFGGYAFPQGTTVVIPVRWLHMGQGSWADAHTFRPNRFDKAKGSAAERGQIGRYGNIPFFAGLHKCLGMHVAMLEMRIFSALLLREWQFELDEARLDSTRDSQDLVVNHMNVSRGVPHFNVYLKLKKRARA